MGIISSLKSALNRCPDEDYHIHQRKRAFNLLKFLEDNNLLSKTSKLSTETFSDDFELYGWDLTDEGDEWYDQAVDRWYDSFDRGQSPDNKKLIKFCIKHKFKRTKGDKWSSGYRDVYDEIHADIYFKEATEYHWKGEPCLLIVLNEKKLKEYAQRVYKRSIKKNGKFARSEAREYILTALEVIRLAMDNKEKDLIRILHFQYIDPAIHIYVSKLPKEECKALEKSLVLG